MKQQELLKGGKKREKEVPSKKYFVAVRTKMGWDTLVFEDVFEIKEYLNRNKHKIFDNSPPWTPLLNRGSSVLKSSP